MYKENVSDVYKKGKEKDVFSMYDFNFRELPYSFNRVFQTSF